jgi:hypothetical protein
MKIDRVDDSIFLISLAENQLKVFMACIRESFATLDRREFPARIGASSEEVLSISLELKELMEREGINF